MKKTIITSLLIVLSISLQAQNWWSGYEKIKGNGNVIIQTRSIDNFDELSVGGSFNVNLVNDNKGNITIEGEENILPYIITEVSRKTLKIKFKKNYSIKMTEKLTITVGIEKLNSINLGGSGNIESLDKITTDNLSLNVGGSGNIKINVDATKIKTTVGGSGSIELIGNTKKLDCSIAGSGNLKAYDLTTIELSTSIAGSGNVKVSVTTKIKANIVGSGNIYYKGSPEFIDTKSMGSGSVINKS